MINSYKDLVVWKRAIETTLLVYQTTSFFPKTEQYGLVSQMRRAAISICSNIAEGKSRSTAKDYVQFLRIANGSAVELETQLYLAEHLGFCKTEEYSKISSLLEEVRKMLHGLIKKLTEDF